MNEKAPNLVTSSKSQSVLVDGHRFEIEIYKLEGVSAWTLEVIDAKGTSHVWDDEFSSDSEALAAVMTAFEKEGAAGFLDAENVIQFPRR